MQGHCGGFTSGASILELKWVDFLSEAVEVMADF